MSLRKENPIKACQKVNKSFPMAFSLGAFLYFYGIQYPLFGLVFPDVARADYSETAWLLAYGFVLLSGVVFIAAMSLGFSGNSSVKIKNIRLQGREIKRPPLVLVMFLFLFFAGWSWLMMHLKVGMTIFAEFDPLPYRLTGWLFYGRLFLQPLLLMYITYTYQTSRHRWLIVILTTALGGWASLTSGSRHVAILFSLPLLFSFAKTSRWFIWGAVLSVFVIIATLTRHFVLPFKLGEEFIRIYANPVAQELIVERIWLLPLEYLVGRSMGMEEVLLTMSAGEITPSLGDAFQCLVSVYVPFIKPGEAISIKNIYGLTDDAFGGFALDVFSNLWVCFGGKTVTYGIGLVLSAWFLGFAYLQGAKLFLENGLPIAVSYLFFIFLFLLVVEGRPILFPYILAAIFLIRFTLKIPWLRSFLKVFFVKSGQRGGMNGNFRQRAGRAKVM